MQKFERKILFDLFKSSNGLYAFTFYERYKVEPDIVFKFIAKYESLDVLEFKENRLSLTTFGRDYIQKKKFDLPYGSDKYGNIPKDYIGEKIEINQPYIPDKNELSNEILSL